MLHVFQQQENDKIQALEESLMAAAMHMVCTCIIPYCMIEIYQITL